MKEGGGCYCDISISNSFFSRLNSESKFEEVSDMMSGAFDSITLCKTGIFFLNLGGDLGYTLL